MKRDITFRMPRWAKWCMVLMFAPLLLKAEEPADLSAVVSELGTGLDTVWMLLAAMLVFFMQPGFALVEAGFTRTKNTANILMKNLVDFMFGSLLFWFIGFGLMFGAGSFVGQPHFFNLEMMDAVIDNGLPIEGFSRRCFVLLRQRLFPERWPREPNSRCTCCTPSSSVCLFIRFQVTGHGAEAG